VHLRLQDLIEEVITAKDELEQERRTKMLQILLSVASVSWIFETFEQLLLDLEIGVASDYERDLVKLLFRFSRNSGKLDEFTKTTIAYYCEHQTRTSPQRDSFLRSDNLCGYLLEEVLLCGRQYLHSTVRPLVLFTIKKSAKIMDDQSFKKLVPCMTQTIQDALERIFTKIEEAPELICRIVYLMYKQIHNRGLDKHENVKCALQGFIFFRFFCVSVTFPLQYGILNGDETKLLKKNKAATKALVKISKILSSIAHHHLLRDWRVFG